MNNPVLACRALCKYYQEGHSKIEILRHVDMTIHAGDMMAIIGASGAGKSTLLQLLGGLDQPSEGEVHVMGQCIHQLSEKQRAQSRNRHLGFIYQFHHLLPEFSALENVAMPLLIAGTRIKMATSKAKEMMAQVGLAERFHHRIGQLSGGERQRVAIARALITEPACVLADEPTGNLDQATAHQVYTLMLTLNRTFNTSFVVVTHNSELAAQLQTTWILRQGTLVPANTYSLS